MLHLLQTYLLWGSKPKCNLLPLYCTPLMPMRDMPVWMYGRWSWRWCCTSNMGASCSSYIWHQNFNQTFSNIFFLFLFICKQIALLFGEHFTTFKLWHLFLFILAIISQTYLYWYIILSRIQIGYMLFFLSFYHSFKKYIQICVKIDGKMKGQVGKEEWNVRFRQVSNLSIFKIHISFTNIYSHIKIALTISIKIISTPIYRLISKAERHYFQNRAIYFFNIVIRLTNKSKQ